MNSDALTVITGANWRYARCAEQLLLSAERRRIVQKHRWLVYDLGLHAEQRARIQKRFPWAELRAFDFAAYPEHFSIASGNYAWKPAIVRDVALQTNAPVLWLDSATIILTDLLHVEERIARTGLYTLRGGSQAGQRADRRMLARLGTPPDILDLRERVAGVVGFDPRRPGIREVIDRWFEYASDPALIAPRSPKFKWHMPEQSLLTRIVNERHWRGELDAGEEDIDISAPHPVRWMTSRNKVRPDFPLWADPFSRLYYWGYKKVDQALMRIKRFEKRHVGGWQMLLRENFHVYVGTLGDGRGRRIDCEWNAYYADPFPLEHAGKRWLLAERFEFGRNQGRIVALPLDTHLRAGEDVAVDLPQGHHSFPYVFQREGKVWLLPESSSGRVVDLYVFDDFPRGLRRGRRLLYGVVASDSVLFAHAGRHWLVTSISEEDADNPYLAIYSTDDLGHGVFTPHPVNARKLYAERRYGYGRAAGGWMFMPDGSMLRPMQASENHYGEKLAWMKVTRLDAESFEEIPCAPPPALRDVGTVPDSHHVAMSETLWACDTRDRVGNKAGLRWLLTLPWLRRPLRAPG